MAININQHFGEMVRKYRRQQGLSQLKLAELSTIDLSSVNRIERGIANVTLRNAFKIAKALHVPMYKFLLVDKEARRMDRRNGKEKSL